MSKEKGKIPKYTPEFKIMVVEDMIKNKMGYGETARKYGMYKTPDGGYKRDGKGISGGITTTIKRWEQIYLKEGADGMYSHNHGGYRPENARCQKANKQDLITENRLLKMELEYLKKLDALVRKRMQAEKKEQK